MYYINVFFIYSILGHLMETLLYTILKSNKKSGFLYLWWTPFYGLGIIICFLVYKFIDKRIHNKRKKNIILFIIYFLLYSIFEYSGGVMLEKMYGKEFWNYSKLPLHIGKYVSIGTSLVWAIFTFIYIFWLKKYTDRLIKYIPKYITYILLIMFCLDVIFSILKVFK